MAAEKQQLQALVRDVVANQRAVITASESNDLLTKPGRIARILVWDVGTTWTLDVYDHGSANNNPVWGWVSADGKGEFDLEIPLGTGLRIVTGGTAGKATVIYG